MTAKDLIARKKDLKRDLRVTKVDFKSHGKKCQACWLNFSALEHYIVHTMCEDSFRAETFEVQMEICKYFQNHCLSYYKEEENYVLDKYFFYVFFTKFGIREGAKFIITLCIANHFSHLSIKLERTLEKRSFKIMVAMNRRNYSKICGVVASRHKVARVSVQDAVALYGFKQHSDWKSLEHRYWRERDDIREVYRQFRQDFLIDSLNT